MKIRFTILFSIVSFSLFAQGQQEYFNRRYDFYQSPSNGFDILPYDSGYIAWSSISLTPYSNLKIAILFLDSAGNVLQTKIYGDSIFSTFLGDQGGVCKTFDGEYAIAGSISYSDTSGIVVLYRFNHNGDTLWSKRYGNPSVFQSGWQCKQTRDKGFIITGQTFVYDPNGDMLLIKTDSLGNLQWQNHYGGSGYDIAVSVDTCFDGGFVMCGATESYGPHAFTTFPNGYIVKTDSLGNFQWQQVLGGIYDQGFWQIIQATDSSIFAGGYYSPYDPYQTCCGGDSKPWIVKLDLAGNVIWQKTYGDSLDDNCLFTIKELPNGDIIGTGEANDPENYYAERGLVIKVNTNGDSLFYRKYAALSLHSDSYFYDISYDKDHGYICTGTINPNAPDTGTQDVWMLKLDSNGCEVVNCLTVAGINEQHTERDVGINIYPNPVTDDNEVTFTYTVSPQQSIITIYNAEGKEVAHYSLPQWSSVQHLKLPELASGLYLARLVQGSDVGSVKFLKE